MRWTGLYVVSSSCAGRLSLSDWCQLPPGHERGHNNGRGVTFGDPEYDEETTKDHINPVRELLRAGMVVGLDPQEMCQAALAALTIDGDACD